MELLKKTILKVVDASDIFDFKTGVDGFSIVNGSLTWLGATENSIRVTSSNADPFIFRNVIPFSGNTYRYVHIKYKVTNGTATRAQIFYGVSGGHSYDGNFYKNFSITSDNDWHVAVIDMSTLTGPGASNDWTTHMIDRFRYDPSTSHPTTVDIKYIVISDSFYPYDDTITTGTTYGINVLLSQESDDIGFFDPYLFSGGSTGTTIHYQPYTVTGESTSRLNELKKFAVNVPFNKQYASGGTYSTDGVDYSVSVSGVSVTYYLGGIKYIDLIVNNSTVTKFTFTGSGMTSPDFINKQIYQNPDKENIISNPKINDDVFIIRQELSAFENNYRLEYVKGLQELETYAGGNFFNIVKNT
jgi:hypothetical protein